jgi:hypothetical protein
MNRPQLPFGARFLPFSGEIPALRNRDGRAEDFFSSLLMAKSSNFADRSRVFRSNRRLRSPERRMWVDWAAKPHHPRPAATFFSAAGRPVLPLSFNLGLDRGHAHDGGVRNRQIARTSAAVPFVR